MISSGDKTFENFQDYLDCLANEKKSIRRKIYSFFLRKKDKIKDIQYEIKYGFQRMFRGYDDVDVFGLNDKFIERYIKILKSFKKNSMSYPAQLETHEEWMQIIDTMISYFKLADSDDPYYDGIDFIKAEEEAYEYRKKALELFVKWFDDLWD